MKLIFEGTVDEIYSVMGRIVSAQPADADLSGREMVCKYCGCTDAMPCTGGCYWVEPGVCSACADEIGAELSEETLALIEKAAKQPEKRAPAPQQSNDNGSGSPPDITKADILIEKFKWDPKTETKYKSTVFAELPDGRVMLSAWACRIYTTREKILAIPYPIPRGYLESVGSINYTTAIRQYREYLAAQSGDKGEDEDEKYKPFLKGAFSTRPNDHDGGKIGVSA